ncbi:nitrilase [Streptomyces abyssalis]|uniref:Nitrilase n=1 Tax=Streptomyces abyssalis TaxID=933944 RepID=A0A1E7JPC0_9ACTN|nr:pyridoxamine 5'-phosphate oxidase family protein [Streptomyces abyssalis]OEU86504.1 nitrilase [Streptomyces abyssalis]OEU90106.1 nitrilase [Streptomyces abyssalis]
MTSIESQPPEPASADPLAAFWQERRYATLTTLRPDGTPHVVPVSVTYEPGPGREPGTGTRGGTGTGATARVVAGRGSKKVRNIEAAGSDGMRVSLCQFEGRRWSTLEGRARIRTDAAAVADAERRYEERYGRRPRPNPERVLIEIAVERTLGPMA